jgi:hypothetical protein
MFQSGMGKQKTGPVEDARFPRHELGEPVIVVRPHLWSGSIGEVVSLYKDGNHRVRIYGRDGLFFHTEAMPQHLRHWPWKQSPIAI